MNTKQDAINGLHTFLESEDQFLLLTGTHQHEKHQLALSLVLSISTPCCVLFRANSATHVATFLAPIIGTSAMPRSRQGIRVSGHNLHCDTMNPRSWNSSPTMIDVAVLYPVESWKADNGQECVEDLKRRNVAKVMFVTCTDKNDLHWIQYYDPVSVVYDAEEDRPDYHEDVKEMVASIRTFTPPPNLPAYARTCDPEFLIQVFCNGRCSPKQRWAKLNKPNPGKVAVRNASMGEYVAECLMCGHPAMDNYNW